MTKVLTKVGWNKEFVDKQVPFLPISGLELDNLITYSSNMPWWKGADIEIPGKGKKTVFTLLEALEEMVILPELTPNKPMRTPISAVYRIKGYGDVLVGRVEQGTVIPGTEVIFPPTHTPNLACPGKIFSIEMFHKSIPQAIAGNTVGITIKGLVKDNLPRVGDIMILKNDTSLKAVKEFTCRVQILNYPVEYFVGYTPVACVRAAKSPVRMNKIVWKISKETGYNKAYDPASIKSNEIAEVIFQPQDPIVVDTFKNCEGLGRIVFMEGDTLVMFGKVVETVDDGIPLQDPKND
jgi:elongation factor 1-alpha